jgi:hypothetical protein
MIKELYSFWISKESITEEKEQRDDGVFIKEVKKSVPKKIILKQPSARDQEIVRTVYAVAWSKAVKDGLLPKQMLAKLYQDGGGLMSEEDAKEYYNLLKSLHEKQLEFQKLSLKSDPDEETKTKLKTLSEELGSIYTSIQLFESEQAQAFDQTAEVFAKNKAIQSLLFNLTYIEENDTPVLFFKGKNDKEKEDYYFKLVEEDDKFSAKVIEKALLMITFWYSGRVASKEDFEYMEKQLNEPDSKES